MTGTISRAGGSGRVRWGTLGPRGTRALPHRGWAPSGRIAIRRHVTGTGPVAPHRTSPAPPPLRHRGQRSAEAREVYEEGVRIPITKLFISDEPNHELFKLIRANVRTPDETIGDLYAQRSSNAVGARELLHFMDEYELDAIDPLADEIITRSERALREAIRKLPDGCYENDAWSDGFDEPIYIKVTLTIQGEDILIDFAGSSLQSPWGINVVLNYTHAYASFAIKAAISPEIPHNEGSFRPVHVTAPLGSILNCVEPAAVASRHIIGHFLPGVIFGALSQAMPEQLMAGGADPIWIEVWRGKWPASNETFTFSLFQCGGTGARATKDGLNTTGFPSGVAGVPAEVMESLTPLIQYRRELRTDSGGPGFYRGARQESPRYSETRTDRILRRYAR